MNKSIETSSVSMNLKKPSIHRLVLAITLAGFSLTAQAGKIISIPSPTVPGVQNGFGGWNLDNVDVILNGAFSTFDESTGAYSFSVDSDYSYVSDVDDGIGNVMGQVQAKPWPIGEPAGIKIVNDDFDVKNDKPSNCIMSTSYLDGHYLDTAEPEMVLCSGPFQSHKRFKVAMFPTTVDVADGSSIDLVFNVEAEAGSRDYQVFQKINNWTDSRLEGFTVQVGTGVGTAFVPASDAISGVGVTNLSLSVPSAIWNSSQLADFSTGLFGPIDTQHGRPAGFFDPNKRAGFNIIEYGVSNPGDASGQTDILTSGTILPSAYPDVPAGASVAGQFGNWLPNNMLPFGIFFDDDGNPDTDAQLVAWYGYNPALLTPPSLGWMTGVADGFAAIPDATISDTWAKDPLYSMSVIDDLVNVGLNYVVTVGDVSTFSNFTIRITPVVETTTTPPPSYVGVIPSPTLTFPLSDALITLTPSPEFVPGSLLTVRVADADLNASDVTAETTTVDVITSDGSVAPATITLTELGLDRGVFVANLPDAFSNVAPGVTVTVTYNDAAGTAGQPKDISESSTAAGAVSAGLLSFNPASYTVAEDGGSITVTVERTGGTAGAVSVEYNTKSGTAIGSEDFVPDTATLFFADGVTSQTISIAILDDATAENDESFNVVLSGATGGATLGTSIATVTITDTDTDTTSPLDSGGGSNGLFSLGWITYGLVVIGLLGRARRKTS